MQDQSMPASRSWRRGYGEDSDRFGSIQESIRLAIAEAKENLADVQGRVKVNSERAAHLYGCAIGSQTEGDAAADAALREAEQNLLRGERRTRELASEIAYLEALESKLMGRLDGAPEASNAEPVHHGTCEPSRDRRRSPRRGLCNVYYKRGSGDRNRRDRLSLCRISGFASQCVAPRFGSSRIRRATGLLRSFGIDRTATPSL